MRVTHLLPLEPALPLQSPQFPLELRDAGKEAGGAPPGGRVVSVLVRPAAELLPRALGVEGGVAVQAFGHGGTPQGGGTSGYGGNAAYANGMRGTRYIMRGNAW